MRFCYGDTETYSEVPLKRGTSVYAAEAEVLLYPYAFDDGEADLWDVAADPMPGDLREATHDGKTEFVYHNAWFDRNVLGAAQPEACPPLNRTRCTMAQALAHGLPGGLGILGQILGLPEDEQKLAEGAALMRLFCIPPAANVKRPRATRHTHPGEWERFKGYATRDVVAMRAIAKRLPTWNYSGLELELWRLDQVINGRGFAVDVELARQAVRATDAEKRRLAARTVELTAGELEAATQRAKLLAFLLRAHGVSLPDMKADTLERRLNDDNLPSEVRELLAVRLESAGTSQTKYKRLLSSVSEDGRLRGTLQFCGAKRTGRAGGRIFQPQNLPRPTMSFEWVELAIAAFKTESEDLCLA